MKSLPSSRARLLLALPLVGLACGGAGDPIDEPAPGGGGEAPAGSASAGQNTARGTIGGKEFVPTSALAHAGRGYVHGEVDAPALDLIFSSAPDVCRRAQADHHLPGETSIALYSVRAALGSDTVDDAKLVIVDATCAPGTRLDKEGAPVVSARRVPGGANVTITRLDAERVEGTVSVKFEDLSTFEGSFSLVPCAGSSGFGDSPVCAAP